jgi:bifunctional pyridoxal-dependent enzyme with beta-cystathionase and maltose regulon repressor activities
MVDEICFSANLKDGQVFSEDTLKDITELCNKKDVLEILHKPFDSEELKSNLNSMLNRK